MSRRTAAGLLASLLLLGLFGVATFLPVPYVTMSPGLTVDVFSERNGEEIVSVDAERTYPSKGRLELTTVSVTSAGHDLSLAEALAAWFDNTRAVYPRNVVYEPERSVDEIRQESTVQMVSSQDTAVAAALRELGYRLPKTAEVLAVNEGAPAEGRLRARDRIIEVEGETVTDASAVAETVTAAGVGADIDFTVRRAGQTRTVEVTTGPAADDPERAVVGVVVGQGFDFPFEVSVNIDDRIGGPSAGLIFALAVYDRLTPGALTEGLRLAGTGTITPKGVVGPIGGIQQKLVSAADSGAELFLVPPSNCAAALEAPVDEDEMRLVRAETLANAIASIEAYAADHDAELPECGERG